MPDSGKEWSYGERSRKPSLPGQVLMELYLEPQNTSLAVFAERTGICIRELSALLSMEACL